MTDSDSDELLTEPSSSQIGEFSPDPTMPFQPPLDTPTNTQSDKYGRFRSHIWDYAVKPDGSDKYLVNKARRYGNAVSANLIKINGPIAHLRKHGITPNPTPRVTGQASIISRAMEAGAEAQKLRKRQRSDYEAAFDARVFQGLYVRWIAMGSHSFAEVESPSFRSLIQYISRDAEACLPTSHATVAQ
ncbi:MAG: hypothetical protein MMC33_002331 [Icmadophila ericetorum]|nr:hypothetical protein [Icmadophila ericetorum]